MLKDAIKWAYENMDERGIIRPKEHGFVDLVRKYFIENDIEHPPISFEDIKPFLN